MVFLDSDLSCWRCPSKKKQEIKVFKGFINSKRFSNWTVDLFLSKVPNKLNLLVNPFWLRLCLGTICSPLFSLLLVHVLCHWTEVVLYVWVNILDLTGFLLTLTYTTIQKSPLSCIYLGSIIWATQSVDKLQKLFLDCIAKALKYLNINDLSNGACLAVQLRWTSLCKLYFKEHFL